MLLALAPALAPQLWLRLALVAPAALVAAWVALDTPAIDHRPGFFGPVLDRFYNGVGGFYDVAVPFSAVGHQRMHGVLLLAIFGFCAVLAQAIAARRPLPALLALIAGAGWPAALYPSGSIALGAMILAAALWVLAGLRPTRPAPALLAGAALVVVAAVASSSAAVAKDGVLAWEQWSPGWDRRQAGLGPLRLERELRRDLVSEEEDDRASDHGPQARALLAGDDPRQLRLPTAGSRTRRRSRPRRAGTAPRRPAPAAAGREPATPGCGRTSRCSALSESRIVAAAQPVALDGPQLGTVFRLSDGIVQVHNGLRRGQTYTVYSYAPRPGPAELAPLPADYPAALERFLDVGRTRVDPFGTPGRDRLVDGLFEDERYLALWPYEAMWERARLLRADARTPYGAVLAIETWLRETGGFAYDESPPTPAGAPPLAHFVADGKRGYCQHFAGAMALMLRMLGVPRASPPASRAGRTRTAAGR